MRGRRVQLELTEGSPGTLSGRCYHAADAEGEARVVARAGDFHDESRVTVHTMDLSSLIARRTESGSLGSGAPEQDAEAGTAARVSARPAGQGPDLTWPAIIIGVALFLLIVGGVVLVRRRKRPASGIAGLPGVDLSGPEIQSAYRSSIPPPPEPSARREDMICPTCRHGYPPGTTTCTRDGTDLVPYSEFKADAGPDNVCPTCGEHYPANVKFCGKDGSVLEPRG